MQSEPIEETIKLIISNHAAIRGDSLTGFVYDVDHYFGDIPKDIIVTSDADCLLTISVKPPQDFEKIQDIQTWLESIWTKFAYRHYQAHSCETYLEAVVLRFVTVGQFGDAFVSGAILANASNHDTLVAKYNRDFAQFAPLRSLPLRWRNLTEPSMN